MPTSQFTQDLRRTATETGFAVVGLTDLAVERVREVRARATEVRGDLEAKKLSERVQQAPTAAVSGALEAAGRVEEAYGELTVRGRDLVERVRSQRATQDLVEQGRSTLSRTRAAVTTGRRATQETQTSAKATVTTARREGEAEEEAGRPTARTGTTRTAAKRTGTTARKGAASTRAATKGAGTSARKTAGKAGKAAQAAGDKVGD